MKTPEELAEEYTKDWWGNLPEAEGMRKSARENFLAGYQAAKDQYKDAINTYNNVSKQMLEEAIRIMTPAHEIAEAQLADADKVMPVTCEYLLDMEKMVDVSSSATLNNWISVKDRLPEENQGWVTVYAANTGWRWIVQPGFYNAKTKTWLSRFLADESNYATFDLVSHWMPLPEPPKDAKE